LPLEILVFKKLNTTSKFNNLRFPPLIMLSDFMQVLSSAKDAYTKNYYFSKHVLFTTNSLLQKQRLNPRNYSKQELIMKLFV
jgi:hypothetical protein